jgi:Cytochrome c554 and c-prime
MFKRVTIVALVVAAFVLMVAVPAMAFNGYRGDYTVTSACAGCHNDPNFLGAPIVVPQWQGTKHAVDAEGPSAAKSLPYGSVCAGCHTSNYAPSKVVPVPTATSTSGAVSWGPSETVVSAPQSTGTAPFSELQIGCSSCHYGAAPVSELDGRDANDTAHRAPYGDMANPDICGACHSRYSYTVDTIPVSPIPTPTASQTTLIQPQMAIGYPMLGSPAPSPSTGWNPAASLSMYLNIPHPGWSPTPDPAATSAGFGRLQTYWQVDGKDSLWQQIGHDGSAAQYPEWASEGHANALTVLTSQAFWGFMSESDKQTCLECHSADFRILKANGENPQSTDVKYGVTCVGCHAPHDAGTVKGVWDEDFDAQLNNDASLGGNGSNVCTECHNGELPEGTTASPGAEIHHPMKEMMDGYGAIDVSAFPSVHKGKCIQCHMPPTSLSRGSVQLGGNHTFNIITPADAVDASPVPYATATASVATATPVPSGTPVITTTLTVTQDSMPVSACSTCHNKVNPVKENPEPVATTTATPIPDASPLKVTVTVLQNANQNPVANMTGGDKALWLQDTIDQRQSWTKMMVGDGVATGPGGFIITGKIGDVLQSAAANMGYANAQDAYDALVPLANNVRTTAERAFLTSFTNSEFVVSEGSFGLHNWDYSREIVNAAMSQAKIAQSGVVVKLPWKVTLKLSKSSMKVNTSVTFSGTVKTARGVAGTGQVFLYKLKKPSGQWLRWQLIDLKADGSWSLTKKMTSKGTFNFRATMPGNSLNEQGTSKPILQLVVK